MGQGLKRITSRLTWVEKGNCVRYICPVSGSAVGPPSTSKPLHTMKQDHLHYVLLDASGSMQNCYDTTLSTLNEQSAAMREVQKNNPDQNIKFSVSDFSDDYRMWFAPKPIGEIREFREEQYQLRGCTALYDALGTLITRTIDHVGEDAPSKGTSISIMTLTDGYENASRIFSSGALRLLIDNLTQKGWEFRFIGADVDPLEVGRAIGMDARRTRRFAKEELDGYSPYMHAEVHGIIAEKRRRFNLF